MAPVEGEVTEATGATEACAASEADATGGWHYWCR